MWLKRKNRLYDYVPLVPPIQKSPIDFTHSETEAYFAWFTGHIDERAEYLRNRVARDLQIPVDGLNFSIESLKPVWKWFLDIADYDKRLARKFHSADAFTLVKSPLSVNSLCAIRDIGMYVGKMFTTRYPCLSWTVKTKPKNYISVNEPLLVGFVDDDPSYPKPFYPDFEPCGVVYTLALGLFDQTAREDDLYDVCMKFSGWIPKISDELQRGVAFE